IIFHMRLLVVFALASLGYAAALVAPSQDGTALKRALDDHTVYSELKIRTDDGLTLIDRNMSPHQAETLVARCCVTNKG
ncbi:hypothetical protein FRC01_012186, partial [Tulasnella sp. 417]